jgi:polysaccharide pyruvyl transferase WcaK-like protein
MPSVVTIGAAYSANKGAASMVQSLLDNLPTHAGEVDVVAVSTHADADRRTYARAGIDVEAVAQSPPELALVQFPLALLVGLLRTLRLPYRWLLRPRALRVLHDADLVADLSGISFVDGRRFIVIVYNAIVVWVPLLLGTPVVKCSQAMGPFRAPVNRALARFTLPRMARVCPRGAATEDHLRSLDLRNLTPAGDMAFSMEVTDEVRRRMADVLADRGVGRYLVVSPSQVVDTYCQGETIPYPQLMASFIDAVGQATDRHVVVIAHSAQPDAGVNHLNDLPLCRRIASLAHDRDRLVFLDEDLLPTELRAVIAGADALVTSRFHAMISALAEHVPTLVIGWSHKYAEILVPFGLAEWALTYEDLSDAAGIVARTEAMLAATDDIRQRLATHLPAAHAASLANFEVLAEELRAASAR